MANDDVVQAKEGIKPEEIKQKENLKVENENGTTQVTEAKDDIKTEEVKKDNENGTNQQEKDPKVELTKLERDIERQVEYYFSEGNMRRDKFLNQKISENEEKWIDISVLLTFNRLKAITEDAKAIADTFVKSPNATVQLSEDRLKLRRHPDNPLPEFNETRRKETQARTAYAKGFPLDSEIATLIDYFHENFEGVEQVVMRKYFDDKEKKYLFKGSVFVTFKTKELAEQFVSKPELKYKEKELLRYTQPKYIEAKHKEMADKKKKKDKKNGKEAEVEKEAFVLPKATVVKFTIPESEISREEIKERIAELDSSLDISYVGFRKGETEGNIRFSKENDATKFFEKLEGGSVSKALRIS